MSKINKDLLNNEKEKSNSDTLINKYFISEIQELHGGSKKNKKKRKSLKPPKDADSLEKWIKYVNGLDDRQEFTRDCKNYDYIPPMLPPTTRMIICGDFHGDYNLMINSLKISEVIDDSDNWIANPPNTIVIQTGDQIDRCRPHIHRCENPKATHNDEGSDQKILLFMSQLHEKAKVKGGKVISLLGNHEIMNSQGNMNYVSFQGLEEFKDYKDPNNKSLKFQSGKEARVHAFTPGNELAKLLACSRISSVIVGSWLFVHAAILPALMNKFKMTRCDNIRKVNSIIRKWLLGQINITNIRKLLNSDKISPFWPRMLGNIPPNKDNHPDCKKYVEPVLKTLQIGHIVVGHTPQYYVHRDGINFTCGDKKVGRVDIGSSNAFHPFDIMSEDLKKNKNDGHTSESRIVQVLEIINDTDCSIIELRKGVIKKISLK